MLSNCHHCLLQGGYTSSVDPGILTFSNHGCNGTYNIGASSSQLSLTEFTADPKKPPDSIEHDLYNPWLDRNLHFTDDIDISLRDLRKGEEILSDYLKFAADSWESDVLDLREICRGSMVGEVLNYELKKERNEPISLEL